MNDEKKIDALVKRAVDAGLEGLDFLASFSYAELAAGYNGIGPEFLPAGLRGAVTDWLWIFEPPALIHDMRNEVADGTRAAFLYANDEFRRNCLKMAEKTYPRMFRDFRARYRAKAVAQILYDFVSADCFGWKAWMEATARHREKLEKLVGVGETLHPPTPTQISN